MLAEIDLKIPGLLAPTVLKESLGRLDISLPEEGFCRR
jgi:hypothetical protein